MKKQGPALVTSNSDYNWGVVFVGLDQPFTAKAGFTMVVSRRSTHSATLWVCFLPLIFLYFYTFYIFYTFGPTQAF